MKLLKTYPQLQIIQEIAKRKKVKIFLVGGFLRDYQVGIVKNDFDFAVERHALKVARSFARKIKGTFVLLDQDRGCARIVKKINNELWTFDFADFRVKTFKGDLSHRDFTINTLSVDLLKVQSTTELDDVLQDFKKSAIDIKTKRIKMVSAKAFKDDPLRMLRAFSLQATLGFKIEAKTKAQIRKDKDLIKQVSYERIRDELFKILESKNTAFNLKEMDKSGLLEKILPHVRVMYHCTQGGYHHLDVWPHSLETVVQLEGVFDQLRDRLDVVEYLNEPVAGNRSRRALTKLGALVHDIGKPDTKKKENGRVSFHGHEQVGKSIIKPFAKLLKLSTQERHALEDMVRWHLRPGYLSDLKVLSDRAVYRYFRDTKKEAASILLLSLADQRATRGPLTSERDQKVHEKVCLKLLDQFFEKCEEEPIERLISGDDLIKKLRLKPSPLFGRILSDVEEKQTLGKIKTKREAINLAKRIAKA